MKSALCSLLTLLLPLLLPASSATPTPTYRHPHPRPQPQQELATFSDINLVVVTDAHSWISSHIHPDNTPPLTATYGDISSAVHHLKERAALEGKDVFFLNNGDHVEGSGLSDASVYTNGVHGYDLFPLIGMMPFDALNIGNHDLYDNATITFMKNDPASGVDGVTPFVDSWKGNYLTSNTVNVTTKETIGEKYTILTGEVSGRKLLVYGFLYHMTDSCSAVVVEDPSVTVQEDWFAGSLATAVAEGVDAIVVLSHMDLKDPNVGVLLEAIRGGAAVGGQGHLAYIPVQFLTGHTHYRGFNMVDDHSSSFEAGHYLDTLGYMSFALPEKNETRTTPTGPTFFDYQMVDANVDVLMAFTGTDEETFGTEEGAGITAAIEKVVDELNLREILGCPQQNYSFGAGLGREDSLYDLYMQTVIPLGVFDVESGTGNEPYMITSTGTLRYDIFGPGYFYYDDVFAVAPFANVFLYYPGLTGAQIMDVMDDLIAHPVQLEGRRGRNGGDEWKDSKEKETASLPAYLGGPGKIDEEGVYDFYLNDFDESYIVPALAKLLGLTKGQVTKNMVGWRDDPDSLDFVDTTIVWAKAAYGLWECPEADKFEWRKGKRGQA